MAVPDHRPGSVLADDGEDDDLAPYVADARRGDAAATDELLARLRPGLVRYCRARLGSVAGSYVSADDVTGRSPGTAATSPGRCPTVPTRLPVRSR